MSLCMFRSMKFICLLSKLIVKRLLVNDKVYLVKVFICYSALMLQEIRLWLIHFVTDTPCLNQSLDPFEQELPDLYPFGAVKRTMAKKSMLRKNQ